MPGCFEMGLNEIGPKTEAKRSVVPDAVILASGFNLPLLPVGPIFQSNWNVKRRCLMTIDAAHVARILGGAKALGRTVHSLHDLRVTVERGLSVESLDCVARHVASTDRNVLEIKYRIVPKTTLARRTRLTPEESERVERLARVMALAEQVWEDGAHAHEFLHSEQPQLGGARPIDLAHTDLGAREVEDLLMKMEYSLPV
jgi:putative toxin-antitoxin system antitoxin component (TIGR02293 family)